MKPAVLPNLQLTMPYIFNDRIEVNKLQKLIVNDHPYYDRNKQSLGELLLHFFDYYSNRVDFNNEALSIPLCSKIPKKQLLDFNQNQNKLIHIVGPYSPNNVVKSQKCGIVINKIKEANEIIKKTRTLDSILNAK